MSGKPTVGEYMTRDVETVSPDETVKAVAQRMAESNGHNGFPVTQGRTVEGFVSAADLLLADDEAPVFTVMSNDLIVAHPDMKVTDAARVILRSGIQRLPVVDDADNLVGIISNTDVVRSQIERATPSKVGKLMRTLEQIHGVKLREERREVRLTDLTPTQARVYAADELEGRKYELKRGLAEPLVVIDNGGTLHLADGHHRVMAAHEAGIEEMDAYVIITDPRSNLGWPKPPRRRDSTTSPTSKSSTTRAIPSSRPRSGCSDSFVSFRPHTDDRFLRARSEVMGMRSRIKSAMSRAKYAAIGAAIGAAVGGLFSRNAASTGGALGGLAGATLADVRSNPDGVFAEFRSGSDDVGESEDAGATIELADE